ncbi:MAG: VWA domain-containing protein, partial [Acidobacteriota bacterium]|nr:VWA domain-containing protein [Acidobacteriota bacterium]
FDVLCESGSTDDATDDSGESPATWMERRIVLLIDYHHLTMRDRTRMLDQAEEMIRREMAPNEMIMVAALADGLRVEQRFTTDTDEVIETLDRMKFDASLFARDSTATTGKEYFDALTTLMDVLAQYDGAKAVVMLSQASSRGDVKQAWLDEVAQHAGFARTVIYPAIARTYEMPEPKAGLRSTKDGAGGKRILTELAVATGGSMSVRTDDLSSSYRMAQRDLSCRYILGHYLNAEEALQAQTVKIAVDRESAQLRYPSRIRMSSEAERRKSRLRAAFVDPERFENPLMRARVVPIQPRSWGSWDAIVALSFPVPVTFDGAEIDLRARLTRGSNEVDRFREHFSVPPLEMAGIATHPVSLLGNTTLKTGAHSMTVVLTSPDLSEIATASVQFEVPEVPRREAFIRGPVLAREVGEGIAVRASSERQRPATALDDIVGDGKELEPLLVHEVFSTETVLAGCVVCSEGNGLAKNGGVLDRRIIDEEGHTTHVLDPLDLDLVATKTGNLRCQRVLDRLPASTLDPGEYHLEITVVDHSGKSMARQSTPLRVR